MFSINGCYDLHIHSSPDVVERKLDDLELVQRLCAAGMRGCAVKCHMAPTPGRTAILNKLYPEFQAFGSVTLNWPVGGFNARAVETAAKMGARLVWMPTMHAKSYLQFNGTPDAEKGLTVFDHNGALSVSVRQVIQTVKDYDLVLGTGHLSSVEAIAVLQYAHSLGVTRLWVTHASLPATRMTVAELKQCISYGAMIEYSYGHIVSGKCTPRYVAEQILQCGCENVILTTDSGQKNSPYPEECLQLFGEALLKEGLHEEEIRKMMRDNPIRLLEIKA